MTQIRPLWNDPAVQLAVSTKKLLRSLRENIQLGTLLALVAGVVNSLAFLQFNTYVSHVSGHATRVAVEYAGGNRASAGLFFLEFASFILGAGLTSFLLKGQTAASREVTVTVPVLIEMLLLLGFAGLQWAYGGAMSEFTLKFTFILAVAMGMQNAMLHRASGTTVRTTHVTGVATDIGVAMGAAIRAAGEGFWNAPRLGKNRIRWMLRSFIDRLGPGGFIFHCLLLFSFTLGAALGTWGYLFYQDWVLLGPVLLLGGIAWSESRRGSRS